LKKQKLFINIFICFGLIILTFISFYSAEKVDGKVTLKPSLIIDAGHGGFDGGAVAADGTLEKDINLQISQKLSAIAELSGFEAIMVREGDTAVCDQGLDTIRKKKVSDIHNRLELTNKFSEAAFISIHQNSFGQSKYWGTQVFYGPNNDQSKLLAGYIQRDISMNLQKDNHREIKKAEKNLYILYNTDSTAVMVECGFLSNQDECKRLQQEIYQQQLAFEIIRALTEFRFLSDNI